MKETNESEDTTILKNVVDLFIEMDLKEDLLKIHNQILNIEFEKDSLFLESLKDVFKVLDKEIKTVETLFESKEEKKEINIEKRN
jgi:hypothetical protein